jgi:chromosome segregation protein
MKQAGLELEAVAGKERRSLEKLETELRDVAKDIKSVSLRQRTNRDHIKRLELDIAKLESRQQILETLDTTDEFDLSEFSSDLGYLDELITIQAEHEVAIRSALSESIKTLVIAGEEELWDVVSKIPPNRYVANYQSIESHSSAGTLESPDIIGPASQFVTSEQPISNLIDLLLGRVLLVSTNHRDALKLARELKPGFSVVTRDGLIFLAGGLIKSPAVIGQELLKRHEELERIKDALEEKADRLNRGEEESRTLQQELTERQNTENDLSEKIRQITAGIGSSERRLFELRHAKESAESELRQKTSNKGNLEREISSLEERILETGNQIGSYKTESSKFESSIGFANLELKALPAAEIADERRHLEQAVEATKTIVAGRQAVVDSRRATLVQIDEQLDRIGDRIQDLRSREIDMQLEEHRAVASRLQEEMDTLITDMEPDQASLREKREYLASLENKLSEQLVQNQTAENRYLQARLTLNQADNRIEGLRERISADLGLVALPFDEDEIAQSPLPMEDVVDHLPSVDELPKDIEQAIQRLRGQLHRMGGVNPEAPAEYDDTKQRYDFLQQQIVDLTATIEQLEEVIIELDELTSRAFVDTVQKVDENFGEVFRRLFGGGTGRLVLTDPDQLTSTGVDIVARLPNRREQALGLLSGGERSLTATALIFSLLMVSPTPFCVLDEVDAMLDEANINRFRELLQEMSQETQFIIITHNRGTVQVAESVYGVSMGADSASQVISIKPEEYVGFGGAV